MADNPPSPDIRAAALDLLEKWQDAIEQGKPVSPESLCSGQPELLRALEDQIRSLYRCEKILAPNLPAPSTSQPAGPRVLLERYRLEALIGEGGHGQVWKAIDIQLDRPVAIKVPKPSRQLAPDEIDQLLKEARRVARLRHPGIVPVYDARPEGAAHVVISEWIDGTNLEAVLGQGPLDPKRALCLASQLARALEYSHAQGIIHRDIKPANLLLDAEGDLKVCDFGIAANQLELLGSTDRRYTLAYASPEQLRGDPLDHRSDIWGVGVVLFEMLTGTLPFPGASVHNQRQAILTRPLNRPDGMDPHTWAVLDRSLNKEPGGRFQSAGEQAEAIEDELLRLEVGESERTARAETGRRLAATGAFLSVALLVFALLYSFSTINSSGAASSDGPESPQARFFPRSTADSLRDSLVGTPGLLDCREGVTWELAQARQREWAAYLGLPVEKSFYLTNEAPVLFRLIPPGVYIAGTEGPGPDSPRYEVRRQITISRPFYLGRHLTTQREWEELMGENPSWFSRLGGGASRVRSFNTADLPVESVSQEMAWKACAKLSARMGAQVFLPTEWQWEYACRAGSVSDFHPTADGGVPPNPYQISADDPGQTRLGLEGSTHPVETRAPNAFGLYDMHGNVAEWCADMFVADPGRILIDPFSPRGESPVARGGSWRDKPEDCRASRRVPGIFMPSATGIRFAMLAE